MHTKKAQDKSSSKCTGKMNRTKAQEKFTSQLHTKKAQDKSSSKCTRKMNRTKASTSLEDQDSQRTTNFQGHDKSKPQKMPAEHGFMSQSADEHPRNDFIQAKAQNPAAQ